MALHRDSRAVEARLRVEIASMTRILVAEGIMDYSGHVSARLPDGDFFLIQPMATPRGELRPEDALEAGLDGRPRRVGQGPAPPAEIFIHAEIYRARPELRAILHCHPESAILFTLAEGARLVPVRNHASRWAAGIPVHPDPGHIDTAARGAALARSLGDCFALLIRAHGVVLAAESVPALLSDAVHFEENARAQLAASQLGPVDPLSAQDMAGFLDRFDRTAHAAKLWAYYTGKARAAGKLPEAWAAEMGEGLAGSEVGIEGD